MTKGGHKYFEYAFPTSAKYDDESIPKLELTADSPAWDTSEVDFDLQRESHLDYRGQKVAAKNNCPYWIGDMGLWMAYANPGEESHWCLSRAPLQCVTADKSDDSLLGMALEATAQVSLMWTCMSTETYNMCIVHVGK